MKYVLWGTYLIGAIPIPNKQTNRIVTFNPLRGYNHIIINVPYTESLFKHSRVNYFLSYLDVINHTCQQNSLRHLVMGKLKFFRNQQIVFHNCSNYIVVKLFTHLFQCFFLIYKITVQNCSILRWYKK